MNHNVAFFFLRFHPNINFSSYNFDVYIEIIVIKMINSVLGNGLNCFCGEISLKNIIMHIILLFEIFKYYFK